MEPPPRHKSKRYHPHYLGEKYRHGVYCAVFDVDKVTMFVNGNGSEYQMKTQLFNSSRRALLVRCLESSCLISFKTYLTLLRASIPGPTDFAPRIGLKSMISSGAYSGAYCLHDGPYQKVPKAKGSTPSEPVNLRRKLYKHWALSLRAQPLNDVRAYFGEKVALYFAWTAYYTYFLGFAAMIGSGAAAYGVLSAIEYRCSLEVVDPRQVAQSGVDHVRLSESPVRLLEHL